MTPSSSPHLPISPSPHTSHTSDTLPPVPCSLFPVPCSLRLARLVL
ncbi:MAG: hypothetical protein F6J94_22330 [Moorea sp. SIO1F2]|nr:hypothetical protein [Moorena sp. SIO1F2]NEO23634.1 hypothetical protein [Moorena sp. SIO4A5]NET84555.1 hypothetical protein [Moorena sp. SIO1F2]